MCPSEDSSLAFQAPRSRNKGRVRKEGACPSNQGLPGMASVETMVFIWARESCQEMAARVRSCSLAQVNYEAGGPEEANLVIFNKGGI